MPDNIVNSRIKHATKTSSTWSTNNPVLLEGEIGVDSTNHILKVGDGTTAWNSLKAWTLPDVTTTDNGKSLLVSSGAWAVDNLLPVLSSGTKFLRNASGTLSWQNVVTSVTIKANSPLSIDSTSAITTSGTRTLSHATSEVTAGTYTSVTVDTYGHVTAGSSPTTLSGYGITDAKIDSGVITLGSNTITPLTSVSTLDATKLSGTIPSGCYTNTKNTAGSTDTSSKIYLIGATEQGTHPQTYSDNEVYVQNGDLTAKSLTGSLYESNIVWGNTNKINGITPLGLSLSMEHNPNRFAFLNGDLITMEYSSDAGTTWTDYGFSKTEKTQFFTTILNVPIGRTSSSTEATLNSKTRITITAQTQDGVTGTFYTNPKKLLMRVGTSGSLEVLIETRTGTNYISGGDWATFGTYTLRGNSGWNDIPLILNTLGGGKTQTSNNWQIRFTISVSDLGSNAKTALLFSARLFGENGWTTPSNMANTNHLYSFDISQNATFPANVTATKFIGTLQGNADTATKLGTANKGSATQPIYLNAGVPTACTYTLEKSVPSNAVFTDTTYNVVSNSSAGLCPQLPSSMTLPPKFLCQDGTWSAVPYTLTPITSLYDAGKVMMSTTNLGWALSDVKLKTQTASDWSTENPVLDSGVVGLDSTNRLMKVGDGSTAWNNAKGWNGMNDAYDTDSTGSAGRYNITAPGITELYDGLTIRVFLKKAYNSAFNTLNVNGLGEKLIRYRNATAMTSHATTNDIIELTYHTGFDAYSVSYTYCDPVNKANYRGNWATSTAYAVGDSVLYTTDNKYYICIKAHTSGTSTINTTNFKASTTPYSDLALPGVANSVTDGWEFVRAYYSDTNYNYFDYNFRPYSGAYPIYRYKLCVLNKDNKLLPLTLTNQENTTNVIKDPLPDAFKPDQVWIYNTTTTTNANSVVPANILGRGFQHTTCTYTFNTTISSYRMIYLKGTYDNTTGLFSLYINPSATNKDSWYVQVPTNTNNITLSSYFTSGYYYICLGGTYSSNNNLQLFASTIMYYFDGTNLVPYAYKKDVTLTDSNGRETTFNHNGLLATINNSSLNQTIQYTAGGIYMLNNTRSAMIGMIHANDYNGTASSQITINTMGNSRGSSIIHGVSYTIADREYDLYNSVYVETPPHIARLMPTSLTIDDQDSSGNVTAETKISNSLTKFATEIRTNINPTDATGYGIAPSCCVFGGTVADFTTWAKSCNAVMGSVSISADYTLSSTTLPTGWYHFLWIPHRHGGTDSDNNNYGFCILKDFWTSTVYELSFSQSTITKLVKRGCGETISITSADNHVVIDEGGYVQEGRIVTVTVRVHGSADSSTRYYFANLPTPIAPLGVTATSYTTGKPANVGYYYLGVDGRLSNTGTVYKNEAHCINFSYVCNI